MSNRDGNACRTSPHRSEGAGSDTQKGTNLILNMGLPCLVTWVMLVMLATAANGRGIVRGRNRIGRGANDHRNGFCCVSDGESL